MVRSTIGGNGVTGVNGAGGAAAGRRAVRTAQSGPVFTVAMEDPDEVVAADQAGEAGPVSDVSVATMLALLDVHDPTERDRKARRHADVMLDELRALQLSLLSDEDSTPRLRSLAELVASLPSATHPGLRAATASVALRVELELARRAVL